MQIISRAQWGARHPDGFRDAPLPAQEVWLHHSVTLAPDIEWVDADGDGVEDDEERAMRDIEQIGQNNFGGGFSYTFAVMPSGRIYQGHSVHRQGAHTYGRNDKARAIVLVGNYETHAPTEAQQRAVAWLVRHGEDQGWWHSAALNGGHRDVYATACPGRNAYAAIPDINRLAASGENLDLEDDMPSAQEIAEAVWSWKATDSPDPDKMAIDRLIDADGTKLIPNPESPEHWFSRDDWLRWANIAAWSAAGKPAMQLTDEQLQQIGESVADAVRGSLRALSPEDLASIAQAVQDEEDRRERARLEEKV